MNAIRFVPTPMEVMCAVATLVTKSLPTIELVWVRENVIYETTEITVCIA